MANRDFMTWLSGFRYSIADYGYYIDFEKVHRNVEGIKVELNILNSLIGSKNIEATRMINCNSESRGKIKELLISNF